MVELERWTQKRIDPEVVVADAEVAGFTPLLAGEVRALEVSELVAVFVAGRDSEIGDLRHMPAASKARNALWKMYEAWHGLSERRSLGWAIPEWWKLFDVEPSAAHYRSARSFDLGLWIPAEIESARHRACVAALHSERLLKLKAPRAERSVANAIAAICGKEVDYLRWIV